jgi:hypothetical protein
MHEDYEDYDDDDYDYDHPSLNNDYTLYYKFDIGADSPISKWIDGLDDILKDLNIDYTFPSMSGWPVIKFPVSSWNPDTGKGNSFQYLGSNYQGSPIWKKHYFVLNKINNQYKLHVQSHASHFLKQPHYYNGMFDILN